MSYYKGTAHATLQDATLQRDCACGTTCHTMKALLMRHYMTPHYKGTAHATLHDATLHYTWHMINDMVKTICYFILNIVLNLIAIRSHWLAMLICTQVVVSHAVFSQNFGSCFSLIRTTFNNTNNRYSRTVFTVFKRQHHYRDYLSST